MKKTPKHTRKTSKIKPILRYTLFAVIGILAGIFLYQQNAQGVVRDKMPMPFGYGVSVVLSGSMEDRLSVDDLVIIKATDDYEVNDIVVYQDGNSLVIHRIIAIDGDTVTTKGDANNTADKPINKRQIKGELVCDIAGIGTVVRILRQPISIFLISAAALLLIEFSYRKKKGKYNDDLEEIKAEIEKLKEEKNT